MIEGCGCVGVSVMSYEFDGWIVALCKCELLEEDDVK